MLRLIAEHANDLPSGLVPHLERAAERAARAFADAGKRPDTWQLSAYASGWTNHEQARAALARARTLLKSKEPAAALEQLGRDDVNVLVASQDTPLETFEI